MLNEESRNKDVIDWKKLMKKKKEKAPEEIPSQKRRLSFASLKVFGERIDRKTKIEVLVLVISTIAMILVLLFFSSTKRETSPKGTEYLPSEGYGGRELPDSFR